MTGRRGVGTQGLQGFFCSPSMPGRGVSEVEIVGRMLRTRVLGVLAHRLVSFRNDPALPRYVI